MYENMLLNVKLEKSVKHSILTHDTNWSSSYRLLASRTAEERPTGQSRVNFSDPGYQRDWMGDPTLCYLPNQDPPLYLVRER